MMEERRKKIFLYEEQKKFRDVNVHLKASNYSNNQKIGIEILDFLKEDEESGFIKDL